MAPQMNMATPPASTASAKRPRVLMGSPPVPIAARAEGDAELGADFREQLWRVEVRTQARNAIAGERDARDRADRLAIFVRKPCEKDVLATMRANLQARRRREHA